MKNEERKKAQKLIRIIRKTEVPIKGKENIEMVLKYLGKYLSVIEMNKALKSLRGIQIEIPENEIKRLDQVFPKELSLKMLIKLENLKEQSEGESGPLIMQIPGLIMGSGRRKTFSIVGMKEITEAAGRDLKPLWPNPRLKAMMVEETWGDALMAWTSAPLKESKNQNYVSQTLYRAKTLGEGSEIQASMLLAMMLWNIASKEELMKKDTMRLDAFDTERNSLTVCVRTKNVYLLSASLDAQEDTGLGASFVIG